MCGRYSANGKTHKACLTKLAPLTLLSPFEYKGFVKEYILTAKGESSVIQALSPLVNSDASIKIADYIVETIHPQFLIPSPMTHKIFGYRLFNHSKYISDQLRKTLGIPVLDILYKNNTKEQKQLDRNARYNLLNTIEIKKEFISTIQGTDLLLVDDVTTTGATLISCTKVLLEHGAKSITCYALSKDLMYNI